MECVKCGSEDCSFDNASSTWFCKGCNNMFTEDEVKAKSKIHIVFLFMIAFLCLMPGVNFILLGILSTSDIDDKYKNSFISIIVTEYLAGLLAGLYITLCLRVDLNEQLNSLYEKAIESVIDIREVELRDVAKINYDVDFSKFLPKSDNIEVVEQDTLTKDLSMFSGIQLDGKKLLELVNIYHGEDSVILIQTEKMLQKHDKNTYRNYGLMLKGITEGTTDSICYFSIKNEKVIYRDDYEETRLLPLEDLDKKKYIFYVNPKSMFEMLYETIEDYNVFIFTEVKE